MTPSVAVVGGGITGACAASALSLSCEVTVFDQGRRGPGGRASHRRVSAADNGVLPDDSPMPVDDTSTFEFDHGCQFTRADDPRMAALVADWVECGWAERWAGPFGSVGGEGDGRSRDDGCGDFFGLPGSPGAVFVGVGGMHTLPRRVLDACTAKVRRGERVADMMQHQDGRWELFGVSGAAAFHDTAEAEIDGSTAASLGVFDAVILTDASSSFSGWHRASAGAGVPDAVAARVRQRVRVPLFTAMVALDEPLGTAIPFAAFTVRDRSSPLWFAARSQGRPGVPTGAAECWVLVSTPAWAAAEIAREPMQDPATGAFKPQEDSYLKSVPGLSLLAAFADAVAPHLAATGMDMPRACYLQAQRWGSALPAPVLLGGRDEHGHSTTTTTEVLGVRYESSMPPLLPSAEAAKPAASGPAYTCEDVGAVDFVACDDSRIYYAGDFCSHRPPGFEAAVLSGLDVAEHLRRLLL